MNESKLTNKVIDWIWRKHQTRRSRPCRFSPKEITDEVGGVHTSIGRIKDAVLTELKARDVDIRYIKSGNKRYFELR